MRVSSHLWKVIYLVDSAIRLLNNLKGPEI